MSKRAFHMLGSSHADFDEDRMQVDGEELALPSPIALPQMPGQFPGTTYYAACDAPTAPSAIFITFAKLTPAFGFLKLLVTTPLSFAHNLLRKQLIRAEPVYRSDGSRKKIYLDAGLASEPFTPAQTSRSLTARRNKAFKHQSPASFKSPEPPRPTSHVFPSRPETSSPDLPSSSMLSPSLSPGWSTVMASTPMITHITTHINTPTTTPTSPLLSTSIRISPRIPTDHYTANGAATSLSKPLAKRVADLRKQKKPTRELREALKQLEAEQSSPSVAYIHNMLPASETITEEYENDLSTLPDAPTPSPKKTVKLADLHHVKEFYKDEILSNMLDSYIENIASSPSTSQTDITNDSFLLCESPNNTTLSKAIPQNSSSNRPSASPLRQETSETIGFHGIPPETWYSSDEEDEETLDESLLSIELSNELHEKAVLSPPKPKDIKSAIPVISPLIAPLSENENKHLERLADQTDVTKDNDDIAPNLKVRDFKTLLPTLFKGRKSAWLNDNVVNEYLNIIVDHQKSKEGYKHAKNGPAPPIHNFASQFWVNLNKSPKSVLRWATRKQLGGKQFLDVGLVFIPVCENDHWRLVAIRPRLKEIHYLDSLGWSESDIIPKILEWLKLELGDDFEKADWNVIEEQQSERQLNGSDCGVFTCLNALALLRGEEPKRVVACKGMEDARRRIATTLIQGHPTTEM